LTNKRTSCWKPVGNDEQEWIDLPNPSEMTELYLILRVEITEFVRQNHLVGLAIIIRNIWLEYFNQNGISQIQLAFLDNKKPIQQL